MGGSKFFLVLYIDDILLSTNDLNLLRDTKKFLSSNFEMKYLMDIMWPISQSHFHVSCLCSLK